MNLAVIGGIGSGKDFLADYAIRSYGLTRYAFADDVKNVAKVWFPDLYGDTDKKPRALLQAIGTKFREIDEDVWIKSMFESIDGQIEISDMFKLAHESVIVTDCRMPNEYQALKDRGFIFIRITVDENIRLQRMRDRGDIFKDEDMSHHTESYYESFECDYSVDNSGTKEESYRNMIRVLDEILERI